MVLPSIWTWGKEELEDNIIALPKLISQSYKMFHQFQIPWSIDRPGKATRWYYCILAL